jgi:hypothetical protein
MLTPFARTVVIKGEQSSENTSKSTYVSVGLENIVPYPKTATRLQITDAFLGRHHIRL